jgi:ankyrin repeat protein
VVSNYVRFTTFCVLIVAVGCGGGDIGGSAGKVNISSAYAGAEGGDYMACVSALENGLSINKGDSDGKTLLHHAVIGNQEKIVMNLIEDYKADVNAKDKSGKTPLAYAAQAQNERIAAVLRTAGAKE